MVLGTIAEQERTTIKQRQAEGIAAAKYRGVASGRPRVQKLPNWDDVIADLREGKITAIQAMKLTNIKHTIFYKLLNANE